MNSLGKKEFLSFSLQQPPVHFGPGRRVRSRRRWRKIFFEWFFPLEYIPPSSTYAARSKFAKKTFARNFFPALFCPISPNSNSALLRRQVHCERITRLLLLLLVWHAPQCGGRPTTLYIQYPLSFLLKGCTEREREKRKVLSFEHNKAGREGDTTTPNPTRSEASGSHTRSTQGLHHSLLLISSLSSLSSSRLILEMHQRRRKDKGRSEAPTERKEEKIKS